MSAVPVRTAMRSSLTRSRAIIPSARPAWRQARVVAALEEEAGRRLRER